MASSPPEDPSASPLAGLPFGLHDLPAGTLASLVTFLEMRERPRRRTLPNLEAKPDLVPLGDDPERYLALFRRIGERWLWFSRLLMERDELAALVGHPDVAPFALTVGGRDCGLLELDFRQAGEAELVFFGLVEDAIGQGLGRWLMDQAVALAWRRPIRRVWLHTCNFDHPGALAFYRRSGFRPYKLAVEFTPDPRLAGFGRGVDYPDLPPPVVPPGA
jgi:GNAT superfamily N-acetyltransferase